MLKKVPIGSLKPNPFRRLDEYPILREKVDALKQSIESTGFWGTIVARPVADWFEIAFGHHRLIALQETSGSSGLVEIIVRDLSNEQMIKMMARENMEEWGTSAWVEVETIRATIEAYGRREIELPKVPKDTRKDDVRQTIGARPYTMATVAQFLGWTRKDRGERCRPDFKCEVAFKALDAMDAGLLEPSTIKGLSRTQMYDVVIHQSAIRNAEKERAKQEREKAKWAEHKAKQAAKEEAARLEKQSEILRAQADAHDRAADRKAIAFGKVGAESYRADKGREEVNKTAREFKPSIQRSRRLVDLDGFAERVVHTLEGIANGRDQLSSDVRFLLENPEDLSERSRDLLRQSLDSLIRRLAKVRDSFSLTSRSRQDGTGARHVGQSAITTHGQNGDH